MSQFEKRMFNDLKYPNECANCNVDACSVCGHREKRLAAVERFLEAE